MNRFKVHAPFEMTGDQPKAVETLAQGIIDGKKSQTLMGVTGSGKTFTMAKIIEKVQKPTLIISHNKTFGDGFTGGEKRRDNSSQRLVHIWTWKPFRL